jgi:hypothetical protein
MLTWPPHQFTECLEQAVTHRERQVSTFNQVPNSIAKLATEPKSQTTRGLPGFPSEHKWAGVMCQNLPRSPVLLPSLVMLRKTNAHVASGNDLRSAPNRQLHTERDKCLPLIKYANSVAKLATEPKSPNTLTRHLLRFSVRIQVSMCNVLELAQISSITTVFGLPHYHYRPSPPSQTSCHTLN